MAAPSFTGFDYGQGLAYLNQGLGSIANAFKERRDTEALLSAFDQSTRQQAPQQPAPMTLANLAQVPPTQAAPMPQQAFGKTNAMAPADVSKYNTPQAKQEYEAAVGRGLSPVQAAAFVSAKLAESTFNPSAVNPGDGRDGSNSIGGFQWNGPRAEQLKQFAAGKGKRWDDPDVQRDFVFHEMGTTEKYAGDRLRTAQTPEEATAAMLHYLRPAGYTRGNPLAAGSAQARLNNTMAYTTLYGGGQQGNPMAGMQQPAQQAPVQVAQMGMQPSAPSAQAGGITREMVRGLLANPATRAMGQQAWQQMLNPKADYGFQVVGDQLYRTNQRTGQIEPVGISKTLNPLDVRAKELANEKMAAEVQQMRTGVAQQPTEVRAFEYARNNGYQGSFLDYQREVARARESRGDAVTQVEDRKRAAEAAGIKADSPGYQTFLATGKMPREDQQPLSATDKKAILEADEAVAAAQSSISALQQAKELSKRAYEGPLAGMRGEGMALVGSEAGVATKELDNLITSNALSQLKSIFGGAPTEGERKILLDIQGSVSQPDAVRQRIYDRAIQMANRRLQFNQQRAAEMRGGTYYKQGGGSAQPQPQQQPQQAPAINDGMTATNPATGQKIRFSGGKWVPVQ